MWWFFYSLIFGFQFAYLLFPFVCVKDRSKLSWKSHSYLKFTDSAVGSDLGPAKEGVTKGFADWERSPVLVLDRMFLFQMMWEINVMTEEASSLSPAAYLPLVREVQRQVMWSKIIQVNMYHQYGVRSDQIFLRLSLPILILNRNKLTCLWESSESDHVSSRLAQAKLYRSNDF